MGIVVCSFQEVHAVAVEAVEARCLRRFGSSCQVRVDGWSISSASSVLYGSGHMRESEIQWSSLSSIWSRCVKIITALHS